MTKLKFNNEPDEIKSTKFRLNQDDDSEIFQQLQLEMDTIIRDNNNPQPILVKNSPNQDMSLMEPLVYQEEAEAISTFDGEIDFFIRVYPNGLMSNHLKNLPLGSNIHLLGPIGTGLQLTPNETGIKVGFCGGTGILPLIDLVYYYLRLFNTLLNCGEKTSKINKSSSDVRNNDDKELKIGEFTLFASFKTLTEAKAMGYDMIIECLELQKRVGLAIFNAYVTITQLNENEKSLWKGMTGRMQKSFIEKKIKPETNKVYICGPPSFVQYITSIMLGFGFSHSTLFLI